MTEPRARITGRRFGRGTPQPRPLLSEQAPPILLALVLAGSLAGVSRAAPLARVEGVEGPLRGELEAAIGQARTPPATPLEARRRAIGAARDAVLLLRSEGWYEGEATPEPPAGLEPRVRVEPHRRFHFAGARILWQRAAPDSAAAAAAERALKLADGAPGRAADVAAAEGRAVVLLSTDTPELVHLCDRVMVFHKGGVAATLAHAEASEEAIVAAAMGVRKAQTQQGARV